MQNEKQNEKFIRVRYLRALEKFSLSVVKALKRADFDKEKFSELVTKNYKLVEKTPSSTLFDAYPKALLAFVELSLAKASDDDAQSTLLRAANALDKFKKAREYKREKSKKEEF